MIEITLPGGDPIAIAVRAQALASDPSASVFVSASAGSGKTKLLIDRLLRLMLPRRAADGRVIAGAPPMRILCLTYTKAAAAEMAIRLNHTLGRWVTLDDVRLDEELRKLDALAGAQGRTEARALFARVLDLPGGMRIQTIHAFCQSLLRRFPLEAAMSPHFRLVETRESHRSLHEALDRVLHDAPDLARFAELAELADLPGMRSLVGLLRGVEGRLVPAFALLERGEGVFEAALARALDLAGLDGVALRAAVVTPRDEAALVARLRLVAESGSAAVGARATRALDILSGDAAARLAAYEDWLDVWLTAKLEPRAAGGFVNKKLADQHDGLADALMDEAARVARAHAMLAAADAVRLTGLLLALGRPALAGHASAKHGMGAVEFDDLIARTLALLAEPGAAWVLFKLDGGLDHVLLDEVQDTAPAQWEIAGRLTEEFFAGLGQQPDAVARTVFAVGDFKQSIFGFQGARPESFHEWRDRFAARVEASGGDWRTPGLVVSFRSTQTVLDLVDRVFADPIAARGVAERGHDVPRHIAYRAEVPGRVALWPLARPEAALMPEPGADLDGPWIAPRHNARQVSAVERLAGALAEWIADRIARGSVAAGDILVLVRRRTAFNGLLLRALKTRGVPVTNLLSAGLLDRVAVQDLLALCDALLLPSDDLSVGCVLTSPLGGLSDDSLMALAMDRPASQTLWEALAARADERAEWRAARDFLAALFARVDFDPPHALLSEALGRLGGRARLLARLGAEAAEAIDELLRTALAWSATHPPVLQEFIQWLRESGVETRIEAEGAGDAVRLMTVHGSKGLQAKLVVLADTAGLPNIKDMSLLWPDFSAPDDGWDVDGAGQAAQALPVWVPRKDFASPATAPHAEAMRARAFEEYNRLLYVALTRAADEVLVCGWAGTRALDERSWYARVQAAFEATPGVERAAFPAWEGESLAVADPRWRDVAETRPAAAQAVAEPELPHWLGRAPDWQASAPPVEPRLPQPLAPSRPTDVAFGPAPVAASPLVLTHAGREAGAAARLRGTVTHALLQYLPDLPPGQRRDAAEAYVAAPGFGFGAHAARTVVDEALALLAAPELATLFGPGSQAEQALAGRIGDLVIAGQVDRLAVTPERVIVADFKTNRLPPARVDDVPVAYLRQMAAYRALLAAIHPGRRVVCFLIWTAGVQAMELPDATLDRHAPDADVVSA